MLPRSTSNLKTELETGLLKRIVCTRNLHSAVPWAEEVWIAQSLQKAYCTAKKMLFGTSELAKHAGLWNPLMPAPAKLLCINHNLRAIFLMLSGHGTFLGLGKYSTLAFGFRSVISELP